MAWVSLLVKKHVGAPWAADCNERITSRHKAEWTLPLLAVDVNKPPTVFTAVSVAEWRHAIPRVGEPNRSPELLQIHGYRLRYRRGGSEYIAVATISQIPDRGQK